MTFPDPYLSDAKIVDEMRTAAPGSLLRALADRPILVDVPVIGQVFDLSQDGGSMAVVLTEVDNLFSGVNSEREWGAFSRGHGICLVVASGHPSYPVGSRFSTPIEHLRRCPSVVVRVDDPLREPVVGDFVRHNDGRQGQVVALSHAPGIRAVRFVRDDGIDDITRDLDGWRAVSIYDPDTHVLVETREFYRRSSSGST